MGLIWFLLILGSVFAFGFGRGERPLVIVLIFAALALFRRLFGLGRASLRRAAGSQGTPGTPPLAIIATSGFRAGPGSTYRWKCEAVGLANSGADDKAIRRPNRNVNEDPDAEQPREELVPGWRVPGRTRYDYDLRIGDAERDAAMAQLREHFVAGRLTFDELTDGSTPPSPPRPSARSTA